MITLPMWRNLAWMGEYYAGLGFQDLPQPWVASLEALHVTIPRGVTPNDLDGLHLVGSAEQAFIDCMLSGRMQPGRWQAITPCFRKEPVYDDLHRPYFMKLELIHYMPDMAAAAALETLITQAHEALGTLLPCGGPEILVEKTEIGLDLTLRGQEIGSYGIREHAGHQWVYGTGLAEPRFTTMLGPLLAVV